MNTQDYGSTTLESATQHKAQGPSESFQRALQQMESDRNVETLVTEFSDDCRLWRQSYAHAYEGAAGAHDFWNQYLNQFESIQTNFTRVMDREGLSILEWESQGALKGERPIHYRGVSILEWDAADKVKSFKTYFDSAPFINHQEGNVRH